MFRPKQQAKPVPVARWLLAHMDRAELHRLLLRQDVPPDLWQLLEGEDGESGLAEPVTGDSPLNQ